VAAVFVMPKHVISDFLGGLSLSDRNAKDNSFFEGREIDIHRDPGYLMPGWLVSTITKSDDGTPIINALINDICVDETTDDVYFGDDDRLYHMNNIITRAFNANFDGSSHYYYAISGSTQIYKLAIYSVNVAAGGAKNYLLYAYKTATKGDVGLYDIVTGGAASFNDNFLSTDVGTGNAALQIAPIDMLEYKAYMFISHGQYVGRFDGPNDTWDATKLDLGVGWEVSKLFPTQNYIGVCAWKVHSAGSGYRTESRIFFWDGTSTTFSYWIPIADNKIENAFNNNGEILLSTYGRDFAATLSKMTEFGSDKIRKSRVPLAGTMTNFTAPRQNAMDSFGNRVIWGNKYLLFSYGQEEKGQPMAFSIPWGVAGDSDSMIGAVKTVLHNQIFFSWYDLTNTKYYLSRISTGNSTRATYRANYFDAGQKIRINYIKFYYKALVSGDDVTPTLELDYGTSKALRDPAGNADITYTNDGVYNSTSKRFDVKEDCHAFRPVISWTAGGVAFSKIVIDYDFIPDV
jgi:hypothetical protein